MVTEHHKGTPWNKVTFRGSRPSPTG
jgi:hypothetical protein